MFLDSCEKLGLLEHSEEANILRDFSLSVRKILVSQVVNFLLDPSTPITILSSPAHVRWAMETCGQGFGLPIEEEYSIMMVVELYRRWALEPLNRPPPIDQEQQVFLQDILRHYSLLFAPRANSPAQVERHASLCSKVLDIFVNIGRQIGHEMSVETWEIFLKLLIGIADSLFASKRGPDDLQRRLCPQMLKVMFELWLHSRTRNPDMWAALKKLAPDWTHLINVIHQWNVTTLALTQRSCALMYGVNEGTSDVIIKLDDTQVLKLEDPYVFYSWHRMLHLLDNPNYIKDPKIFLAAFTGIEVLVQQYLNVGQAKAVAASAKKKSKSSTPDPSTSIPGGDVLPPNGNTILHIFGRWLFEAVQKDRRGFEEGTALAVKILCNIYCTRHDSKFLSIYLASFYEGMSETLRKDGRVLISAIMHCQQLFDYELEGHRVLAPYFLHAIARILTKKVAAFDHIERVENVRMACLHILGGVISLPNHFSDCTFKLIVQGGKTGEKRSRKTSQASDPASDGDVLTAKTYAAVKPYMSAVLLEALKNETNQGNLLLLLNLVYVYMCEDLDHGSTFTKDAITQILRKTTAHTVWPVDVSLLALKVLQAIPSHYSKLDKADETANAVVGALCKYVTNQCLTPTTEKATESLVAETFRCMAHWIVVPSQWLLQQPELVDQIFRSIVLGIGGNAAGGNGSTGSATPSTALDNSGSTPKKSDDPVKRARGHTAASKSAKGTKQDKIKTTSTSRTVERHRVRAAADYLLFNVLNQFGNFPTTAGCERVSTLVSELSLLEDLDDAQSRQHIRNFVVENSMILTVIERPNLERGPGVTIVIRDKTGRYTWNTHLALLPLSSKQHGPLPNYKDEYTGKVTDTPHVVPRVKVTGDDLTEVMQFLQAKASSNLIDLTPKQLKAEHDKLLATNYALQHDISSNPPTPSDTTDLTACKLQYSRLLLSHMMFLSLENRGRVYLAEESANFYHNLKQLDQVPERECEKIGLLYIQKGQTHGAAEVYKNAGGSLDYQEFIASLGWGVNLKSHNGFAGGLDTKTSSGVALPYYADFAREMLFHVSTLMPNDNAQPDEATHKRRQIANDYVLVVWTEDGVESFVPDFKTTSYNAVQIVIAPLKSGLFRVRVFVKHPTIIVGPLTDNMVLSKRVLGPLVRDTCHIAYQAVRAMQEGQFNQFTTRASFIEGITARFKREITLTEFYSNLFIAPTPPNLDTKTVSTVQAVQPGRKRLSGRTAAGIDVDDSDSSSGSPSIAPSPSSLSSASSPAAMSLGASGSGEEEGDEEGRTGTPTRTSRSRSQSRRTSGPASATSPARAVHGTTGEEGRLPAGRSPSLGRHGRTPKKKVPSARPPMPPPS